VTLVTIRQFFIFMHICDKFHQLIFVKITVWILWIIWLFRCLFAFNFNHNIVIIYLYLIILVHYDILYQIFYNLSTIIL
jgi:hypothetical protein